MTDDPWTGLAPPTAAESLNARRVNADGPWGFFWARSVDRKCLLVLRYAPEAAYRGQLPRLKGIEVTASSAEDDGWMLVFKLLDTAHRDIFHRLCQDIINSASAARTEREAVATSLARTWRWHRLLKGGGDGKMTLEEQKGLIGELLVIERYLLPNLSARDAVAAWRGPLGAPKDFEVGRIAIEAKARRGAATPFIQISSEHQLDDSGVDALFVYVAELDQSPSDAEGGFSLSDIIRRVSSQIASSDNGATDQFEILLAATGFSIQDDYSDTRWVEGRGRVYQTADGFPRITATEIETGVLNVKYSISLLECDRFLLEESALTAAIAGAGHGN
jgi:hypothetical protein